MPTAINTDLIERVTEEHLPRKKPHTQAQYLRMFRLHIRPALGRLKAAPLLIGFRGAAFS